MCYDVLFFYSLIRLTQLHVYDCSTKKIPDFFIPGARERNQPEDTQEQHVMISYNWNEQRKTLKVMFHIFQNKMLLKHTTQWYLL